MEGPLDGVFDRLIKEGGQEGDNSQAEANRAPNPESLVLESLHGLTGVLDNRVDSKGGESHAGEALENTSLHHDRSIVLKRSDHTWFSRFQLPRLVSGNEASEHALVLQVCLVAFIGNVAQYVEPRNSVGGSHQIRMCDGSEGFADIRGVRDIAMR